MTIAGQQCINVVNQVKQVKNFLQKKRKQGVTSGFVNNYLLKLHYKYTFYFCTFIYLVIINSWFQKDVMACVNKFSADSQIRADFLNICFTYLYVPTMGANRYLFFYRYIHYVVLSIAGVYYLPHKYVKNNDDMRTIRLLNEIEPTLKMNEDQLDVKVYSKVPAYLKKYVGTNGSLYCKSLFGCILALAIDVFAFFFLDWILHGKFLYYGFMTLPFNRDPEYYMDYMSQTFPPFAECTVGPVNELLSKREETYGCHLTMMELYEKIFYAFWVWLALLIVADVIYITRHLFFLFPWYRTMVKKSYTEADFAEEDGCKYNGEIDEALSSFGIGDTYLLSRLQKEPVMTKNRYYVCLCHYALSRDRGDLAGVQADTNIDDNSGNQGKQCMAGFAPKNVNPDMTGPMGAGMNVGWQMAAMRGQGPIRR